MGVPTAVTEQLKLLVLNSCGFEQNSRVLIPGTTLGVAAGSLPSLTQEMV